MGEIVKVPCASRTGQMTGLLKKMSFASGAVWLGAFRCLGLEASDVLFFSKGPVSLRPQLSVGGTFNDNIFYNNSDKASDFYTTLSPGLNLQVGTEDYNFFKLGYTFEHLNYFDHSELDADQHHFLIQDHFERSRFVIEGNDTIDFLSSIVAGGIQLNSLKVDRMVYGDHYRLDYRLTEKTGVYGEIVNAITDFDQDVPLFDSSTQIGTAGFKFQALPHTSFFGEIYYGQTATPPNSQPIKPPHAEFIGGFLGAQGNFTEKLMGMVKAGYEQREYSQPGLGQGLPVVEISLTEHFTENMALSLMYSRHQYVSVQFAAVGYTTDSITLQWLQNIGNDNRLHLNSKVVYNSLEYQPNVSFSHRSDTIIGANVDLTYDFKAWLRGTLAYDYERLRSDYAPILEYDVNRVMLKIDIGY
jgi:hypothetical protein